MLITPCAAIFDAFGHGVFLHPNDVISQIPAFVSEGKCQHPRDTDHIFGFTAFNTTIERNRLSVASVGILRIRVITLIALAAICVCNIQPECPIRTQNAPDFGKHFRQARYILCRRFLSPDLPVNSVISQSIVGRRGHAAMYAVVGQCLEDFKTIAVIDFIKLYAYQLLS